MPVTIFASVLQMGDSSQTLIPSPVQKFGATVLQWKHTGLSTLTSEVQATDPMWESC